MKSEIGECVSVLCRKAWGKTMVGNKLRSRNWWENRLEELVNVSTTKTNHDWEPGIYNQDGNLFEL